MKIEIIKHFENEYGEFGYYLVDGDLIVQNKEEYKAIPFFVGSRIKDSLCGVTAYTKEEIKKAVSEMKKAISEMKKGWNDAE